MGCLVQIFLDKRTCWKMTSRTPKTSTALLLTLVMVLLPQASARAEPKPSASPWPDNIVIVKKLLGENRIFDETSAKNADAILTDACPGFFGKPYTGIHSKEFLELGIVVKETTYLSGRQKIVITEKNYPVSTATSRCDLRFSPGVTYDFSAPGMRWTAIRSPHGTFLHEKNAGRDNSLVSQTQDSAFRQRLKRFSGKWRSTKYDDVEVHFGHRCGYPPNPRNSTTPKAMGEYAAAYEKALAVAQQFHQEGTKLCSLIVSPEHVGTGEKLVLHVKEPKRDHDEAAGCYDFKSAGGVLKRKCNPIVVDFQVNAAMPQGIFDRPDWARGLEPESFEKNPALFK